MAHFEEIPVFVNPAPERIDAQNVGVAGVVDVAELHEARHFVFGLVHFVAERGADQNRPFRVAVKQDSGGEILKPRVVDSVAPSQAVVAVCFDARFDVKGNVHINGKPNFGQIQERHGADAESGVFHQDFARLRVVCHFGRFRRKRTESGLVEIRRGIFQNVFVVFCRNFVGGDKQRERAETRCVHIARFAVY